MCHILLKSKYILWPKNSTIFQSPNLIQYWINNVASTIIALFFTRCVHAFFTCRRWPCQGPCSLYGSPAVFDRGHTLHVRNTVAGFSCATKWILQRVKWLRNKWQAAPLPGADCSYRCIPRQSLDSLDISFKRINFLPTIHRYFNKTSSKSRRWENAPKHLFYMAEHLWVFNIRKERASRTYQPILLQRSQYV